eukprot:352561-Chlamydomonas_euryale.AAC.16
MKGAPCRAGAEPRPTLPCGAGAEPRRILPCRAGAEPRPTLPCRAGAEPRPSLPCGAGTKYWQFLGACCQRAQTHQSSKFPADAVGWGPQRRARPIWCQKPRAESHRPPHGPASHHAQVYMDTLNLAYTLNTNECAGQTNAKLWGGVRPRWAAFASCVPDNVGPIDAKRRTTDPEDESCKRQLVILGCNIADVPSQFVWGSSPYERLIGATLYTERLDCISAQPCSIPSALHYKPLTCTLPHQTPSCSLIPSSNPVLSSSPTLPYPAPLKLNLADRAGQTDRLKKLEELVDSYSRKVWLRCLHTSGLVIQ